ncbi:recombinase family protein [uncultured Pontibacter sp.]|uniref:recombinase family protein n=1 Tax=uncultured Pontibacter sp. TaxID=453356 RepID=UPI00261CA6D8|nr:recombinase family protein [uncultured Pontibacter sp.]
MLIGYARVSTAEQNADLQKDALEKAGCEKIFTDKISGATKERPGLAKAKEMLRRGDTLVVWRLDRLGRSLRDLIDWMNYLEQEGVAFKSLQESIDTSTSTGKLIFHFFGALAEFERNLIQERTQAGLTAARARGRVGGRPEKLSTSKKEMAIDLYNSKKHTVKEICKMVGITKPTLYRYLEPQKEMKKEKAVEK